ncbi:MAG: DUF2911 domain-containing protein [Cyclobacteriaceae bacterium]|nr:DUF2911 domain-containing protein [Cyclobacteriaceae bacterium]MDX5466330.1 DUF2911 domain-containing protein [Cyclobacteriaceae bacterium]
MNKLTILFLGVLLAFACNPKTESTSEAMVDHSQHMAPADSTQQKPKSPKTSAMAMVSGNHIHIDYSSPSVRGRQIFGGLVALGEVWSTGAHKATSIQFEKPVIIQGKEIPAGKYGFFTIPGQTEWTLILNQVWDMHLADDYDSTKDVIRIQVNPETLPETVESLTYTIEETTQGTAKISVAWDKTKVSFTAKNK